MNKYYKNMILCSELDYHCLLCKESFETIPDVDKHIRWEQHRRGIKHQSNVSKLKKFINKIGEIYYCEICNCVVKFESLQKHIKSSDHKEHQSKSTVGCSRVALGKRDQSGSIKFPNLLINRLQWHGIQDMKCKICEESVQNVNDHISTTTHMVHIIQSVIIENGSNYFRKIGENIFYCFQCSDILEENQSSQHICKKNKKQKYSTNKGDENKRINDLSESLEIALYIKDRYEINKNEKMAKCKLCNTSVDITMNALSKHTVKYHEQTTTYIVPEDHGKRRSELAKYGKENFIKLNEGGSKGYCSLCDIYISAHMKLAVAHVNGLRHRGHLELKGLIARRKHSLPGYKTQSFKKFLKDLIHVTPLKAICINSTLCVKEESFMLIQAVKHNMQNKGKCFCCDIFFNWDKLDEHCKSKKHEKAFDSCDVLLIREEFVRVIRPGLFHCGFCNQVYAFWEAMEKHMVSPNHLEAQQESELAFINAMEWYTDQKTNGAFTFSD